MKNLKINLMKQSAIYVPWLLFVLLLNACHENKPAEEKILQFSIDVKMGFAGKTIMYLQQIINNNLKIIDSSKAIGYNAVTFRGKLQEPGFYRLEMKDKGSYVFALDDEPLTITIDGSAEVPLFKSSGSKINKDFQEVSALQSAFQKSVDSLNQAYIMSQNTGDKNAEATINQNFEVLRSKTSVIIKKWISTHTKSIVTVYACSFFEPEKNISYLDSVASSFDEKTAQFTFVQDFITNIAKIKGSNIGSIAPDFEMSTQDGRKIRLSNYKGKVLLVDFWASWCGPCRKENPRVVKLFEKYKDSGFAILGVSLDENMAKWKDAISTDGLIWDQVSDLKGWENKAAVLYGVEEIPQSLLLDKEGRIAGKKLHGKELEDKIIELLAK